MNITRTVDGIALVAMPWDRAEPTTPGPDYAPVLSAAQYGMRRALLAAPDRPASTQEMTALVGASKGEVSRKLISLTDLRLMRAVAITGTNRRTYTLTRAGRMEQAYWRGRE